jgi:WD40 repeat protein
MKKHINLILIIGMAVVLTLACSLPGMISPTPTSEPPSTEVTATDDTSKAPDPTATEALTLPPEPTATTTEPMPVETTPPTNAGQIVYRFQNNLWRYVIDSGETISVTTTDTPGGTPYPLQRAAFSADGRFLAYNLHGQSVILDLSTDTSVDISAQGYFFAWQGEGTQFYAVQGEFECPELEDLEDQDLINFDLLRLDLNDLGSATVLANIGGGLSYLQAISADGKWASVVQCRCYSECGSEGLWRIPTLSPIAPPADLFPGNIDFSPDSTQLTVSQQQIFGYYQSPLYVANSDYSNMVEAFSMPDVAPVNAEWSPTGDWIGFTGIAFAADELTETDRCVRLVRPDGSEDRKVACEFADFITWSPDGSQILYSQADGTQEMLFIYNLATGNKSPLPIQVDPYTTNNIDWGRHP